MKRLNALFAALTIVLCGCDKKLLSFRGEAERSSHDEIDDRFRSGNPGMPNYAGVLLYQRNCASCHGDYSVSTKRDRTAVQITEAIGNVMQMRLLSTLTPEQISEIAKALAGEPPPVIPEPVSGADSSAEAMFATRELVESTLLDIFTNGDGSTAEAQINRTVNLLIHRNQAAFGGPCFFYDDRARCLTFDSTLPMTPKVTIIRKAFSIRVCEEILNGQPLAAVRGALSKVQLNEASPANDATITKVFDVFFPGRPPTADVVSALLDVDASARALNQTQTIRWKYVLLPLCQGSLLDMF